MQVAEHRQAQIVCIHLNLADRFVIATVGKAQALPPAGIGVVQHQPVFSGIGVANQTPDFIEITKFAAGCRQVGAQGARNPKRRVACALRSQQVDVGVAFVGKVNPVTAVVDPHAIGK